MMAVEMKPLDERRKFRIKLKENGCGSKVQNLVLLGCNKRKLSLDTGADDQPNLKKSKMDPSVEKQKLKRVAKDINPSVLNCAATSKSGSALNGDTDLKKLLIAAHAAKLKKQQSAESRKVQQEAKANSDAKALQRTVERKSRAALEKKNINEEDKVLAYNQLLKLCECSLFYDTHIGVVLKMREFKTGKLMDPLASIGLKLKKEFIADATDYDDYVDMDLEEGEIVDSDCVFVGCDVDLEEGEILE